MGNVPFKHFNSDCVITLTDKRGRQKFCTAGLTNYKLQSSYAYVTVYQCIQINGLSSTRCKSHTVTAEPDFSLTHKGCFHIFLVVAENQLGTKIHREHLQ